MGGVARIIKKNPKIFKKVEPKLKTPEEGKKMSKALDEKLSENAEEGNEAAAALLRKRKGRKQTIMTSASGLNEDENINKKTLLG